MRLLHSPAKTRASFDDPNLVSHAGLVPVMALAERAGLGALIAEHVRPGGESGVNAHLRVPCLVAGMAAGADSIDDMDMLQHGAMGTLFGGIRVPSTLGSHLRSCTWGNVAQLEKAGRLGAVPCYLLVGGLTAQFCRQRADAVGDETVHRRRMARLGRVDGAGPSNRARRPRASGVLVLVSACEVFHELAGWRAALHGA